MADTFFVKVQPYGDGVQPYVVSVTASGAITTQEQAEAHVTRTCGVDARGPIKGLKVVPNTPPAQ